MSFALSLPAKLLIPVLAFGGIGAAVLPADLSALPDIKASTVTAAKAVPAFNVAALPADVATKVPVIAAPAPVRVSAAWPAEWTTKEATTTPVATVATVAAASTEPAGLAVEHVNSAVNVRAAGQKGASVLFVLPAGAEVRVAGAQDGWVHVCSDRGEGWVYSTFIGTPKPPIASSTAGTTVQVASVVTVFDAPGGEAVYQLSRNDRIHIVETDGKWGRISTDTGEGGWVRLR